MFVSFFLVVHTFNHCLPTVLYMPLVFLFLCSTQVHTHTHMQIAIITRHSQAVTDYIDASMCAHRTSPLLHQTKIIHFSLMHFLPVVVLTLQAVQTLWSLDFAQPYLYQRETSFHSLPSTCTENHSFCSFG